MSGKYENYETDDVAKVIRKEFPQLTKDQLKRLFDIIDGAVTRAHESHEWDCVED